MIGERLAQWTSPHSSVRDLHTARVLRLVATWHLVTTPLGPLLAGFQVLAGEPERVRALWLVYAPIATFFNYLLTRSPFGSRGLWFQVVSSFLIVVAAILESPDRVAPLMALFLPVLAAALCFESREVLYVQTAALIVVLVRLFQSPAHEKGFYIGVGVVMFSGFVIIFAIVRHRIWLYDQRVSHLLDETRRARAILEAAFDGTAHVVGGVFKSLSPGFSNVIGCEDDALLGRSVAQSLPVELLDSTGREEVVPFVNQQGELRYATLVREVLDSQGAGSEVIAIRDMSQEQMHRVDMQFTDRLAAMGFLASGLAHEVNNALMSLTGHCEIGERALKQGESEKASRSLGAIKLASQRITDCVRELKRFGGRTSKEASAVDLNDLVRSTLRLANYRIRHVARLEVQLVESLPSPLASEGGISQILMNLVLNAMDAVKELDEAVIRVETECSGDEVALLVMDNGPGVPVENQARVFQPFFTTKKHGESSGLGLSISANIAARYGGVLRYLPRDQGACFRLSFPFSSKSPEAPQSLSLAPSAEASWRVLLIDDEPEVLDVLRQHLLPAQVVASSSVSEAQEHWSEDFDLILSDVVMPHEDGIDMYEWIAEAHPEMLRRFFFMSGSAVELEDKLSALQLFNPVLWKPITRDQLLELLHQVMCSDASPQS